MKRNLLPFWAVFAFLVGCSGNPETSSVKAAYQAFSRAVLAGDAAGINRSAPFLVGLPAETRRAFLTGLDGILQKKPAPSIRFQDPDHALVHLNDGQRTVVPFHRNAAGNWLVSDRMVRTMTIDFIGAE